jgi:hypothetical protein
MVGKLEERRRARCFRMGMTLREDHRFAREINRIPDDSVGKRGRSHVICTSIALQENWRTAQDMDLQMAEAMYVTQFCRR